MKTRVFLLVMVLLITASVQGQTYLAIGDSLAFGFQEAKFNALLLSGNYDPNAFNTGFVDLIHGFLRSNDWPALNAVNFSCPGETTSTLVSGGCPLHNWIFAFPLHYDYPGITPQMYAAGAYLQDHPGEVLFITVTIGANDILNVFDSCADDPQCVEQSLPATSTQAAQTVGLVIRVLRGLSPGTVVLYTNVPNPYKFSNPSSMAAFDSFNATMGLAATDAGARVVDWAGALNQVDQASFCALTYVCEAPLFDIHPTDAGYQVLAIKIVEALAQ